MSKKQRLLFKFSVRAVIAREYDLPAVRCGSCPACCCRGKRTKPGKILLEMLTKIDNGSDTYTQKVIRGGTYFSSQMKKRLLIS